MISSSEVQVSYPETVGDWEDRGTVGTIRTAEDTDEGQSGLLGLLQQPLPNPSRRFPVRAERVTSGLEDRAAASDAIGVLPPYASYSSWVRLLDALSDSLPPLIDESYLAGLKLSESSIKPLRSALRFLGLVARDGRPTEKLERLVEALHEGGTAKVEALREIVLRSYSPLFSRDFDLKSATMDELRLYFATMGARGQVQQKCSSFFLNLARDAGLNMSHLLIPQAPVSCDRRGTASAELSMAERRECTQAFSNELGLLLGVFPKFDIDWPEEKKQQWFKDFIRLLKVAGRPDEPQVN